MDDDFDGDESSSPTAGAFSSHSVVPLVGPPSAAADHVRVPAPLIPAPHVVGYGKISSTWQHVNASLPPYLTGSSSLSGFQHLTRAMALGAVSMADAVGNISASLLRHPSIVSATYNPPLCVSLAG